jgi:translation initiation factor 1A
VLVGVACRFRVSGLQSPSPFRFCFSHSLLLHGCFDTLCGSIFLCHERSSTNFILNLLVNFCSPANNPNRNQNCFYDTVGQEYAQVVKMLGNGRCECFCFDGVTRLGHIRGKMRKKVWITAGDIILVAKRDFQDEKVDIVHKYTADEARNLKQYGELPENARINETAVDMAMADDNDDDDIGIAFDDI